jgi:ATP-binding cassette, subfamily B, bacterial PglK
MNKIKECYKLLKSEEKLKVIIIFLFMMFASILEMIGIGLILPTLNLIINDDISFVSNNFTILNSYFETNERRAIIIHLFILIILANFLKAIMMTFINRKSAYYTSHIQIRIMNDLYKKYLESSYSFLSNTNTATLLRNIFSNTNDFTLRVLKSYIWIFSDLVMIFFITLMLMFVSFKVTSIALFSLITIGLVIHLLLKKYNLKYGTERNLNLKLVNKYIIETFRNIKIIKILNSENFFKKKFKTVSQNENISRVKQEILGKLPLIWIEFFAVFSIILSAIIAEMYFDGLINFIPIAGLFLASFFKLLPGLNRVISQLQYISFCEPIFLNLLNEYKYFDLYNPKEKDLSENFTFNFEKNFIIKNLSFKYEENFPYIFKNFNYTFQKNRTYGIIGKSGSGKSTLIDVITGILKPTNGDILADNISVLNSIKPWRRNFGYVPQDTYLSDDTIKENIAFGVKSEDINIEKILKIINQLDLKNLIDNLPKGLDTLAGDYGSRLSGGEKQRIGIARALYFDPKILLLDESTSSLDTVSENKILSLVEGLKKKITILIISHRKSALSICDEILELENIRYEK